jgi:hypothetical protein
VELTVITVLHGVRREGCGREVEGMNTSGWKIAVVSRNMVFQTAFIKDRYCR